MLTRPSMDDLLAHPAFYNKVDINELACFDPKDPNHQVLADVISEGVYRNHLIQIELAKEGASVPTDPLILRFQPGLARTLVTFGPSALQNAGVVVFERESGGVPSIFRLGGWLIKFRDIQIQEDELIWGALRRQKPPQVATDPRYAAINDGEMFKKATMGFRQHRNVEIPGRI